MLVGNDISQFQGAVDWITYASNTNFVIAKATEGVGYIDQWFGNNRQQARQRFLPRGFYHFARPDLGNTPEQEAKSFYDVIDGDPIQEGEILALDFEVQYNDPVGWAKTWLDTVSSHFGGYKPLIYLNQSLATSYDWSPVVDAGYGLWIAAYTYDPTNNNFNIGKWPFAAMQQWTDQQQVPGIQGNVDGDVFFGDTQAFGKYGYQKPQPVEQTPATQPTPTTQPVAQPPVVNPSPVENPSIPVVQVPVHTTGDNTPPVQTKPIVPHAPIKPRMRLLDLIVYILLNIKSTLIKYFK